VGQQVGAADRVGMQGAGHSSATVRACHTADRPVPQMSMVQLAESGADTLVLTVNNRHARRLLGALAAGMQGRTVQQAPRVMPLSAWLRQAAEALVQSQPMAAHVLDTFSAQQLWAQIIREQEAQRPLLDTTQAARLAMEADRLLVDWQLHLPDTAVSDETARFHLWRQAWLARLKRLDAQDAVRLTEAVLQAVTQHSLPLAFQTVVLVGFSELPPAIHTLLAHFRHQGKAVYQLQTPQTPAGLVVRTTADEHVAQWRAAAAWAAQQLQQSPHGRFAIVAAQLEADMPLAHRVLYEALGDASHYNVAVARPLSEWSLVRAALAWLRLLAHFTQQTVCEPAEVGVALLAGLCAGHTTEASARAGLDAYWRRQGTVHVTRQELVQQTRRRAPLLATAWQNALVQAMQHAASAGVDVWVMRFKHLLQCLGFPGDAPQDSAAWQTLQAFELALDRLAGQAFAFGAVRMRQAVGLLDRLLQQTRFQPMRDASARLDVLGLLEADGGQWDAVWVLGLHDTVFPAVPHPNPLLPLALLQQAGTPRATVAREQQWAQATLAQLLHCAPRVLFSHAQEQDGQPLRVSPLLAALPDIPLTQAVQHAWEGFGAENPQVAQQATTRCRLETLLDTQGPPVTGKRPLRGGIGVIDTQARHPQWAFVKYRLGASQLLPYARAAQANVRGNFLHRAIELVWRMLPDQTALRQLPGQTRDALVAQAVAQAADEKLPGYGATLARLEMHRAQQLLGDWLAIEQQRVPFRVQALEPATSWRNGALELHVRMDRIDALEDGGLVVIDYKTGAGSIAVRNDWMRTRPVNLQLPFYATMLAQDVCALWLVKLHTRSIEVRGLAQTQDPCLPKLDTPDVWPAFADWDAVLQHWRSAIQIIAQEVADGVAPNVVLHPADLQYCDVLPFLRLHETVTQDKQGMAHGA